MPQTSPGEQVQRKNWVRELGLDDGQWLIDSKLSLQRVKESEALCEADRILAYLKLQSFAYQGELAVKDKNGEPVQPCDIAKGTETDGPGSGIDRRNIRRGLRTLEERGLIRVEGKTKGKIRIYVLLVPREPAPVPEDCHQECDNFFEGCPPDLAEIFEDTHPRIPDGIVIRDATILEQVRALAIAHQQAKRQAAEAKLSLESLLKSLRTCAPYKEESIESRESAPSSPEPSVISEQQQQETVVVAEPPPAPPKPQPAPEVEAANLSSEVGQIHAELLQFDKTVSPRNSAELIAKCREKTPAASVDLMIEAMHFKLRQGGYYEGRIRNPIGFLLRVLPEALENCTASTSNGSRPPQKRRYSEEQCADARAILANPNDPMHHWAKTVTDWEDSWKKKHMESKK